MPIKAMTGLVPEWYTPQTEVDEVEDESQRTAFYCHPLTQPQLLEVQGLYDTVKKTLKPEAYSVAYRLGCRNWRNVIDHTGKPLKWNPGNMDKIPSEIIAEVGANIIAISVLTESDEKN